MYYKWIFPAVHIRGGHWSYRHLFLALQHDDYVFLEQFFRFAFRVSRFAFRVSRFALYASRLCSRQRVFQRKLLICFVWKPSSVVTAFYKWHKCLWLLRSEITFKTFYSRFTFRFVIFKAKMTDGQMLTIASIKYSRLTHEAVTSREKLPCFRIII